MLRRASRPERLDDDQASATAGTREREDTRPVDRIGAVGVGRGSESSQQLADAGDVCGATAIGEETVVAEGVEGGPVGEARVIAEEGEAAISMEFGKPLEKQAPEQPREHAHGEKEVRPACSCAQSSHRAT